jgi:hypothetical protein
MSYATLFGLWADLKRADRLGRKKARPPRLSATQAEAGGVRRAARLGWVDGRWRRWAGRPTVPTPAPTTRPSAPAIPRQRRRVPHWVDSSATRLHLGPDR